RRIELIANRTSRRGRLARPRGSYRLGKVWTLVRGETVEQAVAARALQGRLAAAGGAFFGWPGQVRGIPRLGRVVVAPALTAVISEHRGSRAAGRPVAAGRILAAGVPRPSPRGAC